MKPSSITKILTVIIPVSRLLIILTNSEKWLKKEKRKTMLFSIWSILGFTIPDDRLAISKRERWKKWQKRSKKPPLLPPLPSYRFAIKRSNRCSRSARDLQTETFYVERESKRFYNREKEIKGEARFLRAFTGLLDSCWRTYVRVALAS